MVRTVQGSIRQEQCQARRVAFWESALVIHQLLGTVHSDLLQLIVDRVQPPPPRARKTFPTRRLSSSSGARPGFRPPGHLPRPL